MRAPLLLLSLIALGSSARCADAPSFRGERKVPTASAILELYEDSHYRFVGHGYGNNGEDVPSVFAFSRSAKEWMRIAQVSTRDAVFGRSPDFDKVPMAIGWDHSGLGEREYVDFPLITSAVLLPDRIEFVAKKKSYRLSIGSQYGEGSHPTTFHIPKSELDAFFRNGE